VGDGSTGTVLICLRHAFPAKLPRIGRTRYFERFAMCWTAQGAQGGSMQEAGARPDVQELPRLLERRTSRIETRYYCDSGNKAADEIFGDCKDRLIKLDIGNKRVLCIRTYHPYYGGFGNDGKTGGRRWGKYIDAAASFMRERRPQGAPDGSRLCGSDPRIPERSAVGFTSLPVTRCAALPFGSASSNQKHSRAPLEA